MLFNLDDFTASRITYQCCLALLHLHKHGVAHRDIKPAVGAVHKTCVIAYSLSMLEYPRDKTRTTRSQAWGFWACENHKVRLIAGT